MKKIGTKRGGASKIYYVLKTDGKFGPFPKWTVQARLQ